jgi:hypothetical protein
MLQLPLRTYAAARFRLILYSYTQILGKLKRLILEHDFIYLTFQIAAGNLKIIGLRHVLCAERKKVNVYLEDCRIFYARVFHVARVFS